jgi:hypothetical protein
MTDLFLAASAEIDGPGHCYRWTLKRIWDESTPPMLVIGHNPSTADALKDVPTVRRWRHFADAWGHGGVIAVNLYPYRSPSPDECWKWHRGDGEAWPEEVRVVMERNYHVIQAQANKCTRVVLCWGDLAVRKDVPEKVIASLREKGWILWCFGLTTSGNPKHIMARGRSRVPDSQEPMIWRAA